MRQAKRFLIRFHSSFYNPSADPVGKPHNEDAQTGSGYDICQPVPIVVHTKEARGSCHYISKDNLIYIISSQPCNG